MTNFFTKKNNRATVPDWMLQLFSVIKRYTDMTDRSIKEIINSNSFNTKMKSASFILLLTLVVLSIGISKKANAQEVLCNIDPCTSYTAILRSPDCPSLGMSNSYLVGIGTLPSGAPASSWIGFHASQSAIANEIFTLNFGIRAAGTYTIGFYMATAFQSGAGLSAPGRFSINKSSTQLAVISTPSPPTPWEYQQLSFIHGGGNLILEFDGTANNANNPTDSRVSYHHLANISLVTGTTMIGLCGIPSPCNAGITAPTLTSTTQSNVCPASTADLTSITATTLPTGTTLSWHTATPATTANLVTMPTVVTAGVYHAAFYDSNNDCYSGTNGGGTATTSVTVTISPCLLHLLPQVFLSGAYDVNTGIMYDSLRSKGIIPLTEPYTNLQFFAPETIVSSGIISDSANVLGVSGPDAVVDWVIVELRDQNDYTQVLETNVGLLQRDGDVVNVNGLPSLAFTIPSDDYYITVRHRNHFGVMTATPITLNHTVTIVDFRDPTAPNGINTWNNTMNAQKDLTDGNFGLWTGNAKIDNLIKTEGGTNDKNAIGSTVINAPGNTTFAANYIQPAYSSADLNLDGIVKFEGGSNDKDILSVIIITHILNTTFAANFILREQLPE